MEATQYITSLLANLRAGHRRSLAIALSLLESSEAKEVELAQELVDTVLTTALSMQAPTRRIAVSGAPGVGKSSLIESFGLELVAQGHKVAVLTVDPSSHRTGGSILADKVRMPRLSSSKQAFIRPSASRLSLGGVTDSMRDAITVCEYAGYDTIIIETVGVGQNEVAAASMVDLFVLLVLPNAGDEMQGIKRGIMEVCDLLVITKRDIDIKKTRQAQSIYQGAVRFLLPSHEEWKTTVLTSSTIEPDGCNELLSAVNKFFADNRSAVVARARVSQRMQWFDELLKTKVLEKILTAPFLSNRITEFRNNVQKGLAHPRHSVNQLLENIHLTNNE